MGLTWLEGGRLLLHPQPDGIYMAESVLFPMRFLRFTEAASRATGTATYKTTLDRKPEGLWSSNCCAGRI